MKIILAADHRGYELKEFLKLVLKSQGYEVEDCGPYQLDPLDDYVDFAIKAVSPEKIGKDDFAILICGSGHGMDIVANRYSHIRAVLGFNTAVAAQGRQHEDANVLILPSDWVAGQASQIVDTFLNTPFSNEERHLRRLNKLKQI